ncbi:hypothetical protein RJT34_03709 [Clitoria ternatea]|uniref:Glycosyltransferase n=1 Tax=Clitoria ternatea TaxID=43366 RepID=A0AAN9KJH9_CLITE
MFRHRFLLIANPALGQINPAIHFAKRLINLCPAHVTVVTTLYMHRRITNKPTLPSLSFLAFSDGYDDGFIPTPDNDYSTYASQFKRRGSEFLTNLILSNAQQGHPFTCLLYAPLLPWAPEVAREFHIPTTMLWTQPATVLDIFYYYFHGYRDYINEKTKEDPNSCSVTLPGLPFSLSARDIPSFLLLWKPSVFDFVLPTFEKQIQDLDLEANPTVLVNTFEALETEALRAVDKFNMIPIGPLIPSAFLDGKNDPDDDGYMGGDLFQVSNDYVEWLDSKKEKSVVYVSFGSYFEVSKKQREEIAHALLDCGFPFLWVIRENEKQEEDMSFREELEKKGKMVKWCSQVEVLSHRSLGCFVTHCGWNSSLESLVSGVPMVAFPQWSDQKTNAKLIEEVWKIGVRVDNEVSEDGIVEAEEIKRGLQVVMGNGEKGEELRMNAEKLKGLAREAAKEGGPLERNLKTFLDDVGTGPT